MCRSGGSAGRKTIKESSRANTLAHRLFTSTISHAGLLHHNSTRSRKALLEYAFIRAQQSGDSKGGTGQKSLQGRNYKVLKRIWLVTLDKQKKLGKRRQQKKSFNTESITYSRKETTSSPRATKGYRGEQEEAKLNCTGGQEIKNHQGPIANTLDAGVAVIRGSRNGLDKHLPGKSG